MVELIAYGSGDVLEHVFQAMAALINGKSGTLYQPLIRLGLILGLMAALVSMIYGNRGQFSDPLAAALLFDPYPSFCPHNNPHDHGSDLEHKI